MENPMTDTASSAKNFDWQGMEAAAVAQLVAAVRRARAEHPHERVYGAMFHGFYGDGEVMYWPSLMVGTEELLAQVLAEALAGYAKGENPADLEHGLRWSGADLDAARPGHEPGHVENGWASRCQAAASAAGGFAAWEKVYGRFLRVFPRAAKRARTQLVKEGVTGKDFIAVACDEAGELIPLSLTRAQISRHFPEYDEEAQERARLAALPVAERVAELAQQAMGTAEPGPLDTEACEALLCEAGKAAVPALTDVLTGRSRGEAWKAAQLLAQINHAAPEAIAALEHVMTDPNVDKPGRAWAARALARLGHMDVILRHAAQLPVETVATGLAAPYTSFRDHGKHRPLDYAPLEAALRAHPEWADAVAAELEPGRGFCEIDDSEVPAARAGLASPFAFIREHARWVLEEWEER
jgi:hypothetical protein